MLRRALPLLVCLAAAPALAYSESLHALLTSRAFPGREAWLREELAAPTAEELAAFRARVWLLGSQLEEPALRAGFLARFPNAEALDAWAFKELLMLDPAATVHGFDLAAQEPSGPRGQLLPEMSRWPDDDRRNRSRFLRDAKREPVRGEDGQPLPFDPETLHMGPLTGVSSQAHAHYGLLPPPLSDDPEVLKKDPRRFAVPPNTRTFGVEFAQLYTDLALVAQASGLRSAPWLTAAYAGASFHHQQDVANQIHTVQVGIYEFFEAAFIQSKLRDLRTLGGLLGERASLEQLGLRLIANHHLWLEDLFAKRLALAAGGKPMSAEMAREFAALGEDDVAFHDRAAQAMEAARQGDGAETAALMRTLIDLSSAEGPDCYRAAWGLTSQTLHDGLGHKYDDETGDDPDTFLDSARPGAAARLAAFEQLEARGVRRATTAQRLWLAAFEAEAARPGADSRAVARLVRGLLAYHREAEARRAAYHLAPPARQQIAWGYGIALVVLLGLGGLLVRAWWRRGRAA